MQHATTHRMRSASPTRTYCGISCDKIGEHEYLNARGGRKVEIIANPAQMPTCTKCRRFLANG